MAVIKIVILINICHVILVCSQFLRSPCPDFFAYNIDNDGQIIGELQVRPFAKIPMVAIRVNFTIATRLSSSHVGRIQQVRNNQNRDILKYKVTFPTIAPLPRLTSISVNGDIVCSAQGDLPSPNRYITSISLEHTAILTNNNQNQNFNENTHIFSIINPHQNQNVNEGHTSVNFNKPPLNTPAQTTIYHIIGENGELFTVEENGDNIGLPDIPTSNDKPNKIKPEVPLNQIDYAQFSTQKMPISSESTNEAFSATPAMSTQPEKTTITIAITTPAPTTTVKPAPTKTSPVCGVPAQEDQVPLIYKGDSYERGVWPWLVAIYQRKDGSLTFICAGSLISDRHVVSAAHCMHKRSTLTSMKNIVVRVGVYDLEDWGDEHSKTFNLAAAVIHEKYDPKTLAHDILIMTFQKTVQFNNYIRPICIWEGNIDLDRVVGSTGIVTGWGRSETGVGGHGTPRSVKIPIVSTSTCRASKPDFHKLTSDFTLCAGDRKGAGPCLGDSGAGLYIQENYRWQLRGVVSLSLRPKNGDNTCNLDEYIVFTDTAQYLPWISNIIAST